MAPSPDHEPRTAIEMWHRRVSGSGDGIAYRHREGGAWRSLTWREADAAAREVAAGFVALGLGRGDRVCVLSQTRIEWLLADVGATLAGGAVVPIYASNTPEVCAFIVKNCGARLVIVEDAAQLEKILPLASSIPGLRIVHIAGDATLEKADSRGRTLVRLADVLAAHPPSGAGASAPMSFASLREAGRAYLAARPGDLDVRAHAIGPEDTFTIIYTSGTTGHPKGAVLSHRNLAAAVTGACRALHIQPDDEQLLFLPLAHVLGREMAWALVHAGAPTAFCEGLTKIKDNLVEIRPTFMAGVPRVFEKFYAAVKAGAAQGSPVKVRLVAWAFGVGAEYAAALRAGAAPGGWLAFRRRLADKLVLGKLRGKLGLDRCRFLISGGAPLSPEIAEFFHGVGLLILEGYGLTETMAAAFVNQLERYRFGTVGPAIDVVEARIADDGEILMRGPSVFRRYHDNPEATAEAVDADGWFHSGDIGVIEDGFLRITDRKKDIIVTSAGKKVAPQALENALKARSSLVSQVMVYGDKRPFCVALVTPGEDAVRRFGSGDVAKAAASAELQTALRADVDALNATLASFETIKRFAILPTEFSEATGELTPSMKVKRKVVIERHRALIDGLYARPAQD